MKNVTTTVEIKGISVFRESLKFLNYMVSTLSVYALINLVGSWIFTVNLGSKSFGISYTPPHTLFLNHYLKSINCSEWTIYRHYYKVIFIVTKWCINASLGKFTKWCILTLLEKKGLQMFRSYYNNIVLLLYELEPHYNVIIGGPQKDIQVISDTTTLV